MMETRSSIERCGANVVSRRHTLKQGLALISCGLAPAIASSKALSVPKYIGISRSGDAQFNAVLLNVHGEPLNVLELPGRAHGVAANAKHGFATVFARRPGHYLYCFDLSLAAEPRLVSAAPGRHFYGHGVYSNNCDYLFATENDYESARGVVGIYNVIQGYQRVGELDTHGVGPHDIISIPNSNRLIVANGGIRTHH
ncbi:hypothetical protein AB833_08935 [Chromatiales bacterium (ex Bugula neritina AB1)]|nr:hypothetical protein AB833_08935 [Chromatiales bacterium (ex Bugula neritina AB1)]